MGTDDNDKMTELENRILELIELYLLPANDILTVLSEVRLKFIVKARND